MNRVASLLLPFLLAGCWAAPDVDRHAQPGENWADGDTASTAEALGLLSELDRTRMHEVWAELSRYEFVRTRSVTVADDEGTVVSTRSDEVLFSGRGNARTHTVMSVDSTGQHELSLTERMAGSNQDIDSTNWGDLLLPGDPLFLTTPGPSFYRYRTRPDTMIAGVRVRVVEAALGDENTRSGIQWARLYMVDQTLIGVHVHVLQQSLLYSESSRFGVMLSPNPDDVWLPAYVYAASTIGLPFGRLRSYRLRSLYSNYRLL